MIKMPRNLLLIKLEAKELKDSSIIVPDDVKAEMKERKINEAAKGVVVAAGPKCEDFKKGDAVRYPGYIGNLVEDEELGEGLFVVVAENDIIIGFSSK